MKIGVWSMIMMIANETTIHRCSNDMGFIYLLSRHDIVDISKYFTLDNNWEFNSIHWITQRHIYKSPYTSSSTVWCWIFINTGTCYNYTINYSVVSLSQTHPNIRWCGRYKTKIRTNQSPIEEELKIRRRWWIGHTPRIQKNNITRQDWLLNLQGKRRRGRSKYTYRRNVRAEMNKQWYDGMICRG